MNRYDANECAQVLVSVDGGPAEILEELCGSNKDTGWRNKSISSFLSVGNHTITLGGFNNKKTAPLETAAIYFDDVRISGQPTGDIESHCSNGFDDDGDGLVDCLDSDCNGVFDCEYDLELTCSDGLDNDGDGQLDCLDLDCAGVSDCLSAAEQNCNDGLDDDGDGLTDCEDTDCTGSPDCLPVEEADCLNSLDDDGDGLVDCEDAIAWTQTIAMGYPFSVKILMGVNIHLSTVTTNFTTPTIPNMLPVAVLQMKACLLAARFILHSAM